MSASKQRLDIRDMTYIALFAAVMAVCSWIAIPLSIPITLQTFAVFVAAGFLGLKRGVISAALYILLGAIGLPVFSGFNSGVGALLGATGGYIIGFLFIAAAVGFASDRWSARPVPLILSMVLGLVACYTFGTAWFMYVYARNTGPVGLSAALSWCVIPYIIPDAVKIAAAVMAVIRLKKQIKNNGRQ